MIEHRTHPRFWECYNSLPADAQRQASSAYERLVQDPFHPSIHLKSVGNYWSARAGLHYRALAVRKGDVFLWFWIGPHHEYDRLIKG